MDNNKNVIEFVGNLNYKNYKELKDIVIDSVNIIMSVSNLTIYGLSKLTKIHHNTLKNILILNKTGIFRTYSNLNQFVKKVIIAEDKNDKHFGFENTGVENDDVPLLVLDENFTGDIN